MSRSIGNELPEPLIRLLGGNDLQGPDGVVVLLLSTTEHGWPHQTMLSVGEVIAVSPRVLRVALWPGSTSVGNLERTGKAALTLVHDGVAYSLRCDAVECSPIVVAGASLAHFSLVVHEALVDVAEYAELTSGITFKLRDPKLVLGRWRETINRLHQEFYCEEQGQV